MKRRDSILQQYYMGKLPKFQDRGLNLGWSGPKNILTGQSQPRSFLNARNLEEIRQAEQYRQQRDRIAQEDREAGSILTYKNNPEWFDNHAVYHDDPRWNDKIRKAVYSGNYGYNPTTGALYNLNPGDRTVVDASTQEQATEGWGRKTYDERFNSSTAAGTALRKDVVASGMKEMVRNPLFYAPGAVAAGMIAGPAAAAGLRSALPTVATYLNAPLTIGSKVFPAVTTNNLLASYFAADFLGNRAPQIPGQIQRGEYAEAAANTAMGALDLYGANMLNRGAYKGLISATPKLFNSGQRTVVPQLASGPTGVNVNSYDIYSRFRAPDGQITDELLHRYQTADQTIRTEGQKYLNLLASPEGIRRLQYQVRRANPSFTDEQVKHIVATRLNEVNTAINLNENRFVLDHGLGAENTPSHSAVEYSMPVWNAHHTPFSLNPNVKPVFARPGMFPNQGGKTSVLWGKERDEGYKVFTDPDYNPGSIALGAGYETHVPTLSHEIGHAIASGGRLPVDDDLYNLMLPKNMLDNLWERYLRKYNTQAYNSLNYFRKNRNGFANEPYPFLREQRAVMVNDNIIKGEYSPINFKRLLAARLNAGRYDDVEVSGNRLIHIVPPWKWGKLAKIMNTAPAVVPAVGAATYMFTNPETGEELQQQKQGGPIVDPRGQWAHPGKVTRIPSSNITMRGVPYPVLAKANNGMQMLMMPGQDYEFPGAEYVDEYPLEKAQTGQLIKPMIRPSGDIPSYFPMQKLPMLPKVAPAPLPQQDVTQLNPFQRAYNEALNLGMTKEAAKLLVNQLSMESRQFTSPVYMTSNNPMGMKVPAQRKSPYITGAADRMPPPKEGAQPYAKYNSLEDAVRDLKHWLDYSKIDLNQQTPETYAEALRKANYYGKTEEAKRHYLAGLLGQGRRIDREKLIQYQTQGAVTKSQKGKNVCPPGFVNIEGKCFDRRDPNYKKLYELGIGRFDDKGILVSSNTELPEVVVKPKATLDFIDFAGLDAGQKYAFDQLGKKYGFPNVELLKNLNPSAFEEFMFGFTDGSGKWRSMKETAHYDRNNKTMFVNNISEYISELAHHSDPFLRDPSRYFLHDLPARLTQKNLYDTKGTSEYVAHNEIEPKLLDEFDKHQIYHYNNIYNHDSQRLLSPAERKLLFDQYFNKMLTAPRIISGFKSGGQYGGLDRWFAEKWVDIKSGKPCGRQEGEDRDYPACRPSRRVSSKTPKTSKEMSPGEKARFKEVKQSSTRIPYNHKRR